MLVYMYVYHMQFVLIQYINMYTLIYSFLLIDYVCVYLSIHIYHVSWIHMYIVRQYPLRPQRSARGGQRPGQAGCI